MKSKSSRVRTIQKILWLSEREHQLIKKRMSAYRLSNFSRYARQVLCRGEFVVRDYSYLKEMNAQIARIGNNLNQIVRLARESKNIYMDDIKAIKKEMSDLQSEVKATLTRLKNEERGIYGDGE